MSIMKDLWMEEYDRLYAEAEESGLPIDEDELGRKADIASRDRFADMVDESWKRYKDGGYAKKGE